jgi:hypothetical protein
MKTYIKWLSEIEKLSEKDRLYFDIEDFRLMLELFNKNIQAEAAYEMMVNVQRINFQKEH